ncbi:MAG: glutamate mutase L [Armatimonadetes bacterium]|nr:glutamate mutase L [Armatimonadota bacterium]MCX7778355.1 glutamate mutase L [Armatimonadota bacterium]
MKTILATDCGSTTTKAILIEHSDERYRLIARGEAPTTVEAPFDDVTIGVLNAMRELEDLTGRRFLLNGRVHVRHKKSHDDIGCDIYVSTSSAGGGLQMMVTGVVKTMTAESAQRAALGAGAIVMDVIAIDDGRAEHERIQRMRSLRPDMILLSGGTDGGTITHVLELAELILAANPRPRLGSGMKLPIIYAGNKDAREKAFQLLGDKFDLRIVENIRPTLEVENLQPAREAIHDLFLEHVMQQAPGYSKLASWVSAEIMPTPMAVGKLVELVANERRINVLAVDIGGATTDVFSVFGGRFTRTVSANLGLSYSICNVMVSAGIENISRWLPMKMDEREVRNRLRNKMIRPTTIPHTVESLLLEQAVAREALRLALEHHKQLAVRLKGVHVQRTIGEVLGVIEQETLVDMMKVDLIIGSGGVLSHAPRRNQAMIMLVDAFQPEGVTELAVDSIFMMPHLGVLSQVHPEAALQVFWNDCLIPLGTVIAPRGVGKLGEYVGRLTVSGTKFNIIGKDVRFGEVQLLPVATDETVRIRFEPARQFDVGAGYGKVWEGEVKGGVVGILIDARGRPIQLGDDEDERARRMRNWLMAAGCI